MEQEGKNSREALVLDDKKCMMHTMPACFVVETSLWVRVWTGLLCICDLLKY